MKKRPARSQADGKAFDRTPLLAAVMRHELFGSFNSMTMVAGLLAERARRGAVDQDELVRLSGRLLKQVERATRIVDHYLDFVGMSGEPSGDERCPASELVQVLEAAGLHVADEIDGRAQLLIDSARLRFALERVLAFAAESKKPLEVHIEPDDEDIVIEISHGGGALSVDDLHVFEHGPRKASGLLMDLAVARRILTDAGGEMAPRGGGFHIRVPVAQD